MTTLKRAASWLLPCPRDFYWYTAGLSIAFFVMGHTVTGAVWAGIALVACVIKAIRNE